VVRVVGSPDRRVSLAAVATTALGTAGPIAGNGKHIASPIPYDATCSVGSYFTTFTAATFHVHLAEVEVDPETGKITILRYVVAQDVGKAINPAAIEGQIHGGVVQGLGYTLYENLRLEGGRCLERGFSTYRLPTARDAPPIEIILLEHPAPDGPFGAQGDAEPPIVPVAAVIANAVSDAIGRPINRLPITPFDVLAALREEGRERGRR
jgi:CO/xanthine dehydrogenase Mo-binding subunit